MSGYGSEREVREVIAASLRMYDLDPRDFSISGIVRDAFYSRGAGYGWGSNGSDAWDAALVKHRKSVGA